MFQKVHRYLEKKTPPRPPVLMEMEQKAKKEGFPIVGPLVGRLLYQLTLMTKARKVLELGSGFGYSAFWFSLAMKGRGHIIMSDGNRNNKRQALEYFQRAGLKSHIDYHVGDALNIIRKQDGPFDIIFNDIDKKDYPKTIELVASRLKKGGLFITDNLIWSGRVCDREKDTNTKAIVEFTEKLYNDNRFVTTIIPLRDGVSISLRV